MGSWRGLGVSVVETVRCRKTRAWWLALCLALVSVVSSRGIVEGGRKERKHARWEGETRNPGCE